ncbi:MAG: RseA family anti-sigma factor, partial [Myxococcota bacterium]|nr:RseA family anti-sigma factor [Myxococcota bacterium]
MNPELDEQLSALIDGELDEAAAARLRQQIDASPELRQRFLALRGVDERVRGLAGPAVPSDLHARLRARIDGDDGDTGRDTEAKPTAPVARPLARRT